MPASVEVPTGQEDVPPGRGVLVGLVTVVGLLSAIHVPFALTVPAAVLLVWMLALAPAGPRRQGRLEGRTERWSTYAVVLLLAVGAGMASLMGEFHAESVVVAVAVPIVAGIGMISALRASLAWAYFVALAVYLGLVVLTSDVMLDVHFLLVDSIRGLLAGHDPYALTFPNPYSETQTARYYAPEFISGDRINVGFPYLPTALFLDLPGYLVGDLQWSSAVAVFLTVLLAWKLTSDEVGRLLAVALGVNPLTLLVVTYDWVEPFLGLGVALLAWSVSRRRPAGGVAGIVLLLTVKQYAVVWLPLERLVRRTLGARVLIGGVLIAAVVITPFVVADPQAFWRAAVLLQMRQPFREDSRSLVVEVATLGGWTPSALASALSLCAGVATAWWVRRKAPPSATWASAGLGLSLLATVLLSKQAFANYYFLVLVALTFAAVSWPGDSKLRSSGGPPTLERGDGASVTPGLRRAP